jgi:hypothetical protein
LGVAPREISLIEFDLLQFLLGGFLEQDEFVLSFGESPQEFV